MTQPINRLDLRQLRHFVTVAQCGNFSLAAEQLSLTQSALSKSIRVMEQQLSTRLLDRGPNGTQLTLFGQRLLGYAQLMLSLADEAVDEIDALRGARRGSLRIGALPTALQSLVPDALLRFREKSPDVALFVQEGINETMLPELYNGRLDIIFTVKPSEPLNDDFEWRQVMNLDVSIVCGNQHPLAGAEHVTLRDLVGYDWLLPPLPEPDRLTLDREFRNAGLPRPRVTMETTSITFLKSLVTRSNYLSYLTAASIGVDGGRVHPLKVDGVAFTRDIYAVFRRKGVVRPTVMALLREIG